MRVHPIIRDAVAIGIGRDQANSIGKLRTAAAGRGGGRDDVTRGNRRAERSGKTSPGALSTPTKNRPSSSPEGLAKNSTVAAPAIEPLTSIPFGLPAGQRVAEERIGAGWLLFELVKRPMPRKAFM